MKKLIVLLFSAIVIFAGASAFAKDAKIQSVKMLPVFSADTQSPDRLWVGTFQLVWNDFMDNILKGPVVFKNEKSKLAEELNKQAFKKEMLSENSYYTAYGRTSLALKARIEKAIWEKFEEKSELLDRINWNDPNNAYLMYAMLKKDFKFLARYDILKEESFNNSKTKVKYFGIDKQSRQAMFDSVDVLFYNSPFDYAVALKSDNDEVILYRTNTKKTFDKVYQALNKKAQKYRGEKKFSAGDRLMVPFMTFKNYTNYDELCNKEILNNTTDERLYIAQAMQTADFNMNNTGVKLKSEAVMNIMTMSMPMTVEKRGRNLFFNKTFYLFMKEKDKSMPYFALRVNNMDLYKYQGEVK